MIQSDPEPHIKRRKKQVKSPRNWPHKYLFEFDSQIVDQQWLGGSCVWPPHRKGKVTPPVCSFRSLVLATRVVAQIQQKFRALRAAINIHLATLTPQATRVCCLPKHLPMHHHSVAASHVPAPHTLWLAPSPTIPSSWRLELYSRFRSQFYSSLPGGSG